MCGNNDTKVFNRLCTKDTRTWNVTLCEESVTAIRILKTNQLSLPYVQEEQENTVKREEIMMIMSSLTDAKLSCGGTYKVHQFVEKWYRMN